jgi:hypothetical protein
MYLYLSRMKLLPLCAQRVHAAFNHKIPVLADANTILEWLELTDAGFSVISSLSNASLALESVSMEKPDLIHLPLIAMATGPPLPNPSSLLLLKSMSKNHSLPSAFLGS